MDSPIAFMLLLAHVFRKKRRMGGGGGFITFCSQTLKTKKLAHKKRAYALGFGMKVALPRYNM